MFRASFGFLLALGFVIWRRIRDSLKYFDFAKKSGTIK